MLTICQLQPWKKKKNLNQNTITLELHEFHNFVRKMAAMLSGENVRTYHAMIKINVPARVSLRRFLFFDPFHSIECLLKSYTRRLIGNNFVSNLASSS